MTQDAPGQRRMGLIMQALAWAVFMAPVGTWFAGMLDDRHNPNQAVQSRHLDSGALEVVLKRNRSGHYITSGKINGQAVVFMLDTGATGIAIPEALARDLGLKRGRRMATQTANGIATAYATQLDRVSVGDIALNDVFASIAPGLGTSEVLLGMSFLQHIEFTQRGDTLILRQYPGES